MEDLVSRPAAAVIALAVTLVCLTPLAAGAQTTVQATSAPDAASRHWLLAGGTSTTLRGDCQEDCAAHGTGKYLHTGSLIAAGGIRVTPQMDAGVEVSWVPAETAAGEDLRSTFLLAIAQFRPWKGSGFFIRGGAGMAFIRNFAFDETGSLPPITSKALGLTYGAGWTFRRDQRVGFQLFGSQHVAALGDFQTGGVVSENVIGNFWSVGAAILIR
jgi:hypothetical protein